MNIVSSTGVTLPRQRRFATKVRTGCRTCRARRVKCDEKHPICRNCSMKGRPCQYDLIWRPQEDAPPVSSATPSRSTILSTAPLAQAKTPDADIMEAFRYHITVVLPRNLGHSQADSAYLKMINSRLHISNHGSPPAFIMVKTADRISNVSVRNGVLARQGSTPDTEELWKAFYTYISKALVRVNNHIANHSPMRITLYRVVDLIALARELVDLPWRSHAKGFYALVEYYGGVQAILNSPDPPPPTIALHYVLIAATIGNTNSPVIDQISQADDWSDRDFVQVYTFAFDNGLPCPSSLFLSLRRITRLRVANLPREIYPHLIRVNGMRNLAPPPEKVASVYARAFQVAIPLYAVLSLPKTLTKSFSCTAETRNEADESSSDGSTRLQLRQQLWDTVIIEARRVVPSLVPFLWPLAVLGAASYDALPQDPLVASNATKTSQFAVDAVLADASALDLLTVAALRRRVSCRYARQRALPPLTGLLKKLLGIVCASWLTLVMPWIRGHF
ncbi:hypothetical protein NLG97_g8329 [Lecanicillium saksenae]|uniref:Uncharacterized protein n=1 Tax=Lecanicillium saksenae TaxID=468837 RepID=A0ACC1QL57_9HYPO|nr:hypothetical protein NLG97_g8329 [Lecanicillium saksenae]